jgi:hypothetical protein
VKTSFVTRTTIRASSPGPRTTETALNATVHLRPGDPGTARLGHLASRPRSLPEY